MVDFIDQYKSSYGVEPICKELPIAPSTYYQVKHLISNPDQRSKRAQNDEYLKQEILRVWHENHCVYGALKLWKQMLREGISLARCSVARLMKGLEIQGVRRGRAGQNHSEFAR